MKKGSLSYLDMESTCLTFESKFQNYCLSYGPCLKKNTTQTFGFIAQLT